MQREKSVILRLNSILHTKIREYNENNVLSSVFGEDNSSENNAFENKEFEAFLLSSRDVLCPRLKLIKSSVIFAVVADGKANGKTYIIGPVILSEKSHDGVPFSLFCEGVLMLYDCFSSKFLSANDLVVDAIEKDNSLTDIEKKYSAVNYDYQENSIHHNPYSEEFREQESIRTGDIEALKRCMNETYSGKIGTLAKDPLRNEKNIGIVNITLASRSAMKGGVHPEIAYTLSDAYIQRIEELSSVPEITAYYRNAEFKYASLVKERIDSSASNPLITKAQSLVHKYMHNKIRVKDIAEELKVTPDYLNSLFVKNIQITFSDYIKKEKVRYAKERLVYSDDTIEQIAYAYGFSSQSHFGMVFKKFCNMSPAEYRRNFKAE